MGFSEELGSLLPNDVPHREEVLSKCARHLDLIVEANRQFNLTRITDPREAAIKHVVDSVDALATVCEVQRGFWTPGPARVFRGFLSRSCCRTSTFTLCESVGKKARFVESVVEDLDPDECDRPGERAEEMLKTKRMSK